MAGLVELARLVEMAGLVELARLVDPVFRRAGRWVVGGVGTARLGSQHRPDGLSLGNSITDRHEVA